MISSTVLRPHSGTALPSGVVMPTPQRRDASDDLSPHLPPSSAFHASSSQKMLGKFDNGIHPFAAPQFWNKAQPPRKMSAEILSSVIAALAVASQRLALGSTQSNSKSATHVNKPGAEQLSLSRAPVAPAGRTLISPLSNLFEGSSDALAFEAEKKAAFVTKFAPAELHGLLMLLLQIQNNLARTQAEVMQVALRQIMAATHARANSIRTDAAIAFGVAIGAAALSVSLNVLGTKKSLQGLAIRNRTTTKFDIAEKGFYKAQKETIRLPSDTANDTATKAHSLALAKEAYAATKSERDLAFTQAERMQLKGNAMVQGARIAESFIFAFSALSTGIQRAAQVQMETDKTMADFWRGQVQTEADQRRQALSAALDAMRSLHSLELQGWNSVRIA